MEEEEEEEKIKDCYVRRREVTITDSCAKRGWCAEKKSMSMGVVLRGEEGEEREEEEEEGEEKEEEEEDEEGEC